MNYLLILVICLLPLFAADAAETVYKWTDADGVVHFSKRPPPSGRAETMRLRDAPPPSAATEAASESPEGELYAEAEPPDNSAVEEENRARQCARGRAMLAQIEPRPRVFRVAADGTRTYLSDQERLDLLDEARQLISDHCGA